MNNDLGPFEDAFRTWAERPPTKSAEEAAKDLSVLIRSRGRRRMLRFSALAAAATVIAGVTAVLLRQPSVPVPNPGTVSEFERANEPGDGVVVMWLDDETQLYMTFQLSHDQAAPEGSTQ